MAVSKNSANRTFAIGGVSRPKNVSGYKKVCNFE
jgi:hypothetical protein